VGWQARIAAQVNQPAPALGPKPVGRIDAIDWLRGLAVVLMIQTHLYGWWTSPAARATAAYAVSRWLGGLPFRMFLLMAGMAMAIKFEGQLARGIERRVMVRGGVRRGFEILVLAYLFRLQEYALSFFWDWHDLLRVDILNCIGASMMLAAPLAAPRRGRPQIAACLIVAAVFVALGPFIGPTRAFVGLPLPLRHLTSYIGGPQPMAWFALFPAFAWLLVGIAVGHWWARASREGRLARAFVISAIAGAAMAGTVILIRRIDPYIVHYPSEYAQQMGPGTFFYRLGTIGPLALLAYVLTTGVFRGRFSVMRIFGQTSLLVYWVHVELVYGLLFKRFSQRLTMAEATVAFVLMTAAMLGLSMLRIKYWRGWRPAWEALRRRFGVAEAAR
jgi:uncharacterized membrane protein